MNLIQLSKTAETIANFTWHTLLLQSVHRKTQRGRADRTTMSGYVRHGVKGQAPEPLHGMSNMGTALTRHVKMSDAGGRQR